MSGERASESVEVGDYTFAFMVPAHGRLFVRVTATRSGLEQVSSQSGLVIADSSGDYSYSCAP